jgi:hypothetical protein
VSDSAALATRSKLLQMALGIPDVMDEFDLESMPVERKAELAYDLQRRLTAATEMIAQVTKPVRDLMQQACKEVEASLVASGGKKIMLDSFDAVLEAKTSKVKDIAKLRDLEKVLPADVCAGVFSRHVAVKGHVDDTTLGKLRKVVPDAVLEITLDADGRVLNKLKRDLGADSPAGKIIDEGYYEEKGEPYLRFVPRESAMKKAS